MACSWKCDCPWPARGSEATVFTQQPTTKEELPVWVKADQEVDRAAAAEMATKVFLAGRAQPENRLGPGELMRLPGTQAMRAARLVQVVVQAVGQEVRPVERTAVAQGRSSDKHGCKADGIALVPARSLIRTSRRKNTIMRSQS
jgi:hypothetical protein